MNSLLKKINPTKSVNQSESTKTQSNRIVKVRKDIYIGRRIACAISENSIQLAVAQHNGFNAKIIDIRKIYLTSDITTSDQRELFIRKTLEEYISEFGGVRFSLILTISGSETIYRSINLPLLKGKELDSAISLQIDKIIPFPAEECIYDYRVVENIRNTAIEKISISLFAVTQRHINEKLLPFDKFQKNVTHAYHAHDVIGQLLELLPDFTNNLGYALINIERNHTDISYYRGSQLIFSHVANIGSSFIANRSDHTVYEYFAESLANEVQNSLDYYTGQFSTPFSNQVYIYGDLSYTDVIIKMLTEKFGFSFNLFPSDKISILEAKQIQNSDITACLPVVSAAVSTSRLANLLPDLYKEKQKLRHTNFLGIAAIFLFSILILTGWMFQRSVIEESEERLNKLVAHNNEFQSSPLYTKYITIKQQIALHEMYLSQTAQQTSLYGVMLKEISRLTPDDIRLHGLTLEGSSNSKNVELQGTVRNKSIPPELILAAYVDHLNNSQFLSEVNVDRHVKRTIKDQFELEFTISALGIL